MYIGKKGFIIVGGSFATLLFGTGMFFAGGIWVNKVMNRKLSKMSNILNTGLDALIQQALDGEITQEEFNEKVRNEFNYVSIIGHHSHWY